MTTIAATRGAGLGRPTTSRSGPADRRALDQPHWRQPVLVTPVILFPLILLAVNAAGLDSVTQLPGFPTDSYINFAIVVCFVQGALFAAITAGSELATDIQKGFLDRLALTPARRWAVLLGTMAGGVSVSVHGLGRLPRRRPDLRRRHRVRGRSARWRCSCSAIYIAIAFAGHRRLARDPDGIAAGGAGDVPAAVRPLLPLDDEPAGGVHREELVPHDRRVRTRSAS